MHLRRIYLGVLRVQAILIKVFTLPSVECALGNFRTRGFEPFITMASFHLAIWPAETFARLYVHGGSRENK